jgi:hypothetical protein
MTPSIGTNQLRRHPLAEFENPAYLRGTVPLQPLPPPLRAVLTSLCAPLAMRRTWAVVRDDPATFK